MSTNQRLLPSDLELQLLQGLSKTERVLITVESCTGGLIASRVTRIAGASANYWGGMVAYDNAAKTRLAGVPESLIFRHGAVSPEVARALAQGAIQQARLGGESRDLVAISTTGIAGPSGGSADKPVGLCYIGVALSKGAEVSVHSYEIRLPTGLSRIELQDAFANEALRLAGTFVEQ